MIVIFGEIRSRREVGRGDGAVVHDLNEEGTRRARGVGVYLSFSSRRIEKGKEEKQRVDRCFKVVQYRLLFRPFCRISVTVEVLKLFHLLVCNK